MFDAYKAVVITDEYLDVIEKTLGPADWKKCKNLMHECAESDTLFYIIFDLHRDDLTLETTHANCPADLVDEYFYSTIGENETLWLIRKKK